MWNGKCGEVMGCLNSLRLFWGTQIRAHFELHGLVSHCGTHTWLSQCFPPQKTLKNLWLIYPEKHLTLLYGGLNPGEEKTMWVDTALKAVNNFFSTCLPLCSLCKLPLPESGWKDAAARGYEMKMTDIKPSACLQESFKRLRWNRDGKNCLDIDVKI